MLIAIDGPAGAGKSTVARALARELGFGYLDTGAMYRCVGLLSLQAPPDMSDVSDGAGVSGVSHGAGVSDEPGVSGAQPAALARAAQIELLPAEPVAFDSSARRGGVTQAPPMRVLLDGRDVSEEIRTPAVAEAASRVAADPEVREALVAKQRELIARGDWVAEGRDIATVVAPDAELKIFLTAGPRERARRRAAELGADPETVLAEQALRDERDSTLGRSTLAPAPGAVTLDTSGLGVEEVVAQIARVIPTERERTSPCRGL